MQNSGTSSCRSEHSDNAHQSDDDLHYFRKRRGRGRGRGRVTHGF